MAKVGIFFADGCEEIEGLAVVDICRRAGLEIETISHYGKRYCGWFPSDQIPDRCGI